MGRGILAQVCPEDFVSLIFMVVEGGKCTMQHGKTWSFQTQRVYVQHALLQLLKCGYFTACHLIHPNSPVTGISAQEYTIFSLLCYYSALSIFYL